MFYFICGDVFIFHIIPHPFSVIQLTNVNVYNGFGKDIGNPTEPSYISCHLVQRVMIKSLLVPFNLILKSVSAKKKML